MIFRSMRLRVGPSVLQIKRSVLILGVASLFFILALFYLFWGSDLVAPNAGQAQKNPKANSGKGELGILEQRLAKLEKELWKNRLMLGQVRETVKKLTAMQRESLTDMEISAPRNRSFVLIPQPQCESQQSLQPNTADILSSTIYDEAKFDNPDGGVWKQGWKIEYKPEQWTKEKKMRVFVVPHSHNDPGWLKTFDKYYNDQTKHILNNMLTKMAEDLRWKFIWAEVSFFAPWFETLDESQKEVVRRFLADGQLEIVTGGWVMNDEASTHVYAMIEQMVEGHQWLERNLDYRPRNGWAIDPFGLSPTMAYLLRRMGLENMVIQRVHYSVKKYLAQKKGLEFLWRQSWDRNHSSDILCHLMPFFSYDIPHTCGPDPKTCCQFDFKRLPGNKVNCPWRIPPVPITDKNVADKSWILLDQYRKKSQLFRSNVLLVPLGDDFRFDKPNEWDNQFRNYQKLFEYMNSREDWHVDARLGTLDDYFAAVREEVSVDSRNLPIEFPSYIGDFFAYADREDHYWTGYFASRPFFKSMDRTLEATLRGTEVLFSLVWAENSPTLLTNLKTTESMMRDLIDARRSLGLFQHHDGITGTAKDIVMIDYASKLFSALNNLQKLMGQCAGMLLSRIPLSSPKTVFLEMDEKRSQYNALPQKTLLQFSLEVKEWELVLFNSLSQARQELVTILVSSLNVEVKNAEGENVPCQLAPSYNGFRLIKGRYELTFLAEVKGISLTTYKVQSSLFQVVNKATVTLYNHEKQTDNKEFVIQENDVPNEFTIESLYFKAFFSGTDGMLRQVLSLEENLMTQCHIQFMMYGTRPKGKDRSGAYLFLPDAEAQRIKYTLPRIRVVEGNLFSEVVVFLQNVEHHFRLKNSPGVDGSSLEIYNVVDITREFNKELVMRFYTNVSNSNREFYTDLNGFQMIKRRFETKIPLQANVYPVPTMTYLQDNLSRLTLLTSQPLGVASLKQGWLEVFLDRRLNQDDNRGLQQGVTDNKKTPSLFRLVIEKIPNNKNLSLDGFPSLFVHHVSNSLLHPMFNMIKNVREKNWMQQYSGIHQELPCDIHLLNLRTLQVPEASSLMPDNFTALFLHRFGFDCAFKAPGLNCSLNTGKVSVGSLFPYHFNGNVEEMSLSLMYSGTVFSKDTFIQLSPMEIVALKLQKR